MAGKGFFYINNKNSLVDISLARKISGFQREYNSKMNRLDYERVDLRKFLKQIYRCDSDKDPMAIK